MVKRQYEREKKFSLIDPFNEENKVEGIRIIKGNIYGDLIIERVNDVECNQYIHATPKFYYPGNQSAYTNEWDTNNEYNGFICDKIDGSNILRFVYHDAAGKEFVSYKMRLSPFIKSNKYNKFLELWKYILRHYPEINTMDNHFNYAFELYGLLNKIVIEYKVPLAVALLYKIDSEGKIFPILDQVNTIPAAYCVYKGLLNSKLYHKYNVIAEEQYQKYKNIEGYMFYYQNENNEWMVLKNKSLSIIKDGSHNESGLSYKEIKTTAINACELCDELDIDEIYENTMILLGETESDAVLEINAEKIKRVITDLVAERILQNDVINLYNTLSEEDKKDPKIYMKKIMKSYPAHLSTKVYNAINFKKLTLKAGITTI